MTLGTHINHHQTMSVEQELYLHPQFCGMIPFEIFLIEIVSAQKVEEC